MRKERRSHFSVCLSTLCITAIAAAITRLRQKSDSSVLIPPLTAANTAGLSGRQGLLQLSPQTIAPLRASSHANQIANGATSPVGDPLDFARIIEATEQHPALLTQESHTIMPPHAQTPGCHSAQDSSCNLSRYSHPSPDGSRCLRRQRGNSDLKAYLAMTPTTWCGKLILM